MIGLKRLTMGLLNASGGSRQTSKPMSKSVNRRRETRSPAEGPVTMVVETPLPQEIVGTLLDRSASGFCARYHSSELQRGDRLRFRYKDAEGLAVVIWTRIFGTNIEAGFHIVS